MGDSGARFGPRRRHRPFPCSLARWSGRGWPAELSVRRGGGRASSRSSDPTVPAELLPQSSRCIFPFSSSPPRSTSRSAAVASPSSPWPVALGTAAVVTRHLPRGTMETARTAPPPPRAGARRASPSLPHDCTSPPRRCGRRRESCGGLLQRPQGRRLGSATKVRQRSRGGAEGGEAVKWREPTAPDDDDRLRLQMKATAGNLFALREGNLLSPSLNRRFCRWGTGSFLESVLSPSSSASANRLLLPPLRRGMDATALALYSPAAVTRRSLAKPSFSSLHLCSSSTASFHLRASRNPALRALSPGWRRSRRGSGLVVRAEMFGQLTTGLESAWNKLRGVDVLTKENIAEPMRDIRRALLEADVSLPVVRRFVSSISEKALGADTIKGVRPEQQLVKIVHDELVQLMGGDVSDIVFAKSGPTVILLAGLQGVGKTTVCAKLAFYLKKLGKSCMLVAADVYRPAAIDQLTILGKQVGVPVYSEGTGARPPQITKNAVEEAKSKNIDAIVVDTAGRLQIDKAMMDELKEVKKAVNPTEVLLVVDAMTGQEAAALVTTFNIEIGITGAILTKLDGDSRGGAALSVKEVSGRPIKFVGRGERLEDLELFYPDRMAQRVLGMGDVLSFVEKAQEVMRQEEAVELQKKIMSAKFDFNDFLKQSQNVAKMGSMSRVIGMIPGMNKVTPAQIREAEKRLAFVESMINAMTAEEREKPELLAESRERRIRVAEESGKTEQEVSQLVAQLFQMRAQMQKLMGMVQGQEAIAGMGDLMDSLKAEEKAPPGTARRRRRNIKPKQRDLDAVLS